jgi:CDP-glucose 4,6-dehydratase
MKELKTAYNGKKVIVTGHTGFKGSWLSLWLYHLGAKVLGISDRIITNPSNYETSKLSDIIDTEWLDIADTKSLTSKVVNYSPDYIFHLAAQPIVYTAYENPIETYKTNSLGTANIMESMRHLTNKKKVVAVIITSDKVYDNLEWKWGYREYDKIGGKDPYSASKGMAEIVIRSYVESFFKGEDVNKIVGVARAGNVIGGGDWAVNRIIPDCVKAWSKNEIVKVRNPDSTRPWQHVLEPLSGYLSLGSYLNEKKKQDGTAYNFGPKKDQDRSVSNLINEMQLYWDKVKWKSEDSEKSNKFKEARLLKLNCDKSFEVFKWQPALSFEETVKLTAEWYKKYYENIHLSTLDLSMQQLELYCNIAKSRGLKWAQ